jgi:ABC-type Fe3+-siderophore transport system permease subunit
MNDEILMQFRKLLRISGVFNILSALLLIIPVVYEYYLLFFNNINFAIGLGGQPLSIPTNPLNALFINTAGIGLVLTGAIVLVVSKNPLKNRTIIFLNGIGKLLFAFIIAYYVYTADLIRIIIVFGLIDVIISIGFLYYLKRTKNIKQ